MSLLDELKSESANKKAREQSERDKKAQQQAFYENTIKPKIESIYTYLNQLVEQLNYLQPDIHIDYQVSGDIELTGLNQGDYSIKVDSRERMTEVVLRMYCQAEGELYFEVDSKAEFDKLIDQLHQYRLRYRRRTNKDAKQAVLGGDFTIEKVVPVYFQFEVDIENGCILLWIRNFEHLGLRKIILLPHQVNDGFLDDIGKYILRKTESFMQLTIEEEKINRIRDKVEQDRQHKELELRLAEEHRSQAEQAEREKTLQFRMKRQLKGIYNKVKKKP